jgi:hypothetical protein
LLHARSDGDQAALDRLLPLVYDDLHHLAKLYMAKGTARPHQANHRPGA